MNTETINQAYIFSIFILNGVIIGILFDFFRILRKSFDTPNYITYIEDILFWVLAGMIVFTFLLYTNYAFLTPYVYIFIIISLSFYFKFISRYFYNTEKVIVSTICRIIRVAIKNLIYPLKFILYKVTDRNK